MTLPDHVEAAIVAHARQVSPAECCGLLVGRSTSDSAAPPASLFELRRGRAVVRRTEAKKTTAHRGFEVVEAVPTHNAANDSERRFLVEPRDYFHTIRAARRKGLQVIGVYHSHPRSSATPSPTDRAGGFSDFVFLIVGLTAEPPEVAAWTWRDGNFTPLPIVRSP